MSVVNIAVIKEDFPESCWEAIDLIGVDNFFKLCEKFYYKLAHREGIYIPKKYREQKSIANLIGTENYKKLISYYCGCRLRFCSPGAALKRARQRMVAFEIQKIANRYNLKSRDISRIAAQVRLNK